ncbi:MAG: transposase [Candidatus Phosphoribacter sp.]
MAGDRDLHPDPRHQRQAEAANVTVKNIKRTGRGYRSHQNYRCRIMLYNAARMAA